MAEIMIQHACSFMICTLIGISADESDLEVMVLVRSDMAVLMKAKHARARLRKRFVSSAEIYSSTRSKRAKIHRACVFVGQ